MPCIPPAGFRLMAGYPTFNITAQGDIRGLRRGLLPWGELDDFVTLVMPQNVVVGTAMFSFLGASFPGRPFLRVTGIDAKPYVDRTTAIDFNNDYKHEWWDVTLTYEFLKNQPVISGDPIPFLVHRWSVGGDVFQADNQGLQWDNRVLKGQTVPTSSPPGIVWKYTDILAVACQPRDLRNGPRIITPHIEHEITWPRVPKPPFTAMKKLVGKVNESPISFATGIIHTECLLYNGSQVEMTALSNGDRCWNLTHRFSERQVDAEDQNEFGGWNHFYCASAPDKFKLKNTGTATGIPDVDLCTGLSGFYRLEKKIGKGTCPIGGVTIPDFDVGYNDLLAIFKKRDFSDLFKPDHP